VAEVIPMGSLEVDPLRQAVRKMMSDEGARSRVRGYAGRLREKDGVSHAADIVESHA
jgi:UDP:flavonoid glycosyltransferase YjiC (YdhE family)